MTVIHTYFYMPISVSTLHSMSLIIESCYIHTYTGCFMTWGH